MKKIIFTKKQLSEVIGADFDYLNKDNDNFNEYNGDSEIVTGDQISGKENAKPITTDKYANSIAPRYFYGHRAVCARMNCSKNTSKNSINEENADLKNMTFKIPDKILISLTANRDKYKNIPKKEGYKRLINLLNNPYVKTNEMYQLKKFFENNDKASEEYLLLGGNAMANWVNKELENATDISKGQKEAKRESGIKNAFIKSHSKSFNNGKAHVSNSDKIKKNLGIEYEK